jgi:hypothetical protein
MAEVIRLGKHEEEVLVLGLVRSIKWNLFKGEPNRGQEFRDGCRADALQRTGYNVRSLDNKHQEVVPFGEDIHCTANFADARRMSKALKSSFGDNQEYDHVILDYFFSPVSYYCNGI